LKNTRLFFTTDVHGSERCFAKFINSATVYKADLIILGGDITAKWFLAIVSHPDGTATARFMGTEHILHNESEIRQLESRAKAMGNYVYRTDKAGYEELVSNPSKSSEVFQKLMIESVENFVKLAETRLKGSGVQCYISGGNDDLLLIDDIIKMSDYLKYPEGECVLIDDHHEMITCGNANMTPWNCPRDVSEEELASMIKGLTSKLRDPANSIFNFHCPPYGTQLDSAPKLDANLKPALSAAGGTVMVPVGSTAVRAAIEQYQPLLGLHGHIHESKGIQKIGRSVCINPGSEYTEGILRGFLCELSDKAIKDYVFTSG
jgi:Icc-related predicted phosphoesterase